MIHCKSMEQPPVNRDEIFRYAGCKGRLDELTPLFDGCLDIMLPRLCYRVCYTELAVNITDGTVCIGGFRWESAALAKNLLGCSRAVIFAATVGIEADRLVLAYSRLSPARAVCMQAIGAERVESLCNMLATELQTKKGITLRPRFSPGYGDLSLDVQRDIFKLLDCNRKIGITLNENLMISPTKSVTAIIGVEK